MTVAEASRHMKRRKVRGLVVVKEKEVVGVIVSRDIVYRVVSSETNPADIKVKEVMSSDIVAVSPETTASELARIMTGRKVSRMPIIDGDRLVGIVTQSDLIRTWSGYFDLIKEYSVFESEKDE